MKNKLDFINIRRIVYNRFMIRFIYKNRVNKDYYVSENRANRFLDFINDNSESFEYYAFIRDSNISLEIYRI